MLPSASAAVALTIYLLSIYYPIYYPIYYLVNRIVNRIVNMKGLIMRPCLGAHRPAVGGPSQQVAAKAKEPVRLRAQPIPLQVLAVTPSLPQ